MLLRAITNNDNMLICIINLCVLEFMFTVETFTPFYIQKIFFLLRFRGEIRFYSVSFQLTGGGD